MDQKKQKYRPLQKMFMEVPERYDLLNRMLTWRLDENWRKVAVREIVKDRPGKIMDLCTGTGDLLLRLAKKTNGTADLTGLDYSRPMLEIAEKKAKKKRIHDLTLIHGDVASMPFEDNYFDAIGIAFAFRNLTYKNPDQQNFLKEIYRVTKPGGKFVIIETSQPENPLMRPLFKAYMTLTVEKIGGNLSGHRAAYKYLAHSAKNFYTADEVCNLLKGVGFSEVTWKHFMGGIAALHVARK